MSKPLLHAGDPLQLSAPGNVFAVKVITFQVTVSKNSLSLKKGVGRKQAASRTPYSVCSTLETFDYTFPFCWSFFTWCKWWGNSSFQEKVFGSLVARTNWKLLVKVMWFAACLVLGLLSLKNVNLEIRSCPQCIRLISANIVVIWLLF